MASVLAHELLEASSDPLLNAWFDTHGEENADKCAWKFGKTFPANNGSIYNQTIGTRNFLIQMNWVNRILQTATTKRNGYCAKGL